MTELRVRDDGQVRLAAPDLDRLTFQVEPVPPFRLDFTAWALRRRAANVIDRFDGTTYRRNLVVEGRPLGVEVAQIAPPERPILRVTVRGVSLAPCARFAVSSALTRLLGLDRCLADFYRMATGDPALGPLARDFCGLKPPRFPTFFEALLNAFACQQVTLTLGIQLLNRLAEAYGAGLDEPGGRTFAFPSPDDLVGCEPHDLRALGFSRQKALAMIELAHALAEHRLDLDGLEDLDDAAAVERLQRLRGVGRWTAEYVLLRGLGRLRVFPGDDVGARNNLQRWLGLLEPLGYDGVRRSLARWAPFQGMVYLHLLLRGLQLAGESRKGPTRKKATGRSRAPGARRKGNNAMSIDLKRAYDRPAGSDGQRILVDRIWPRGIAKDQLRIDAWLKDLAPSDGLRKWFGHDPEKWDAFKKRYARELEQRQDALEQLVETARAGHVTLVFGAKDTEHNNAVALKEHLERRLKR